MQFQVVRYCSILLLCTLWPDTRHGAELKRRVHKDGLQEAAVTVDVHNDTEISGEEDIVSRRQVGPFYLCSVLL